MDSGSEHYFDSVEEIYDFAESSPSMKLLPKNDNDEITEDDIIPYYDKATCKTEINLDKHLSALTRKKKSPNKPVPQEYSQCRLKSKSYLDIFRKRFSLDISNAQQDTQTISSCCLDFDDNVDSIYIKSGYQGLSSSRNSSRDQDLALSLSNLNTYKETDCEPTTIQSKYQFSGHKKRSSTTITTNVPVLGKLGQVIPTDKLELLKKRQQYGMKASRINRIKIIEKKALKDLEKEINESKIGCK
ncbi:unnamed protein product [Acanthoscelides obtectus]|uniref:Uncharacterized protein n=1 Tax=Acanthoscelides obtectus TaxID=200917 RepID=A0A9P0KUA0_ACAOB|nr:unnamed protein product [Acanthoscelides obtectus]CAK1676323.1 hypothetical protein AOBTE_LOCUS30693 [Acanthoscelides obtectus]